MQSRLLLALYGVLLVTSSSSMADSQAVWSFSSSASSSTDSSSSGAATDPASAATWYDGDQLRTFWISPSELAVFGDNRVVQTPEEMTRIARQTLPSGTVMQASETLARLKAPPAIVAHPETVQLPSGARLVTPVFYASRDPADNQPYIPTGEVIVIFNSAFGAVEAAAWGEAHGVQLINEVGVANGFVFRCPNEVTCLQTSRDLYDDASTRYAYPNWLKPRETRLFGNADLAVTETASASLIPFGENVTFTITALNQGPDLARNLTLTNALPAALTLISASNSNGFCSTFRGISCSIASLNSGAQATITVVARATSAGTAVSTATLSSRTTGDPNPANNQASAEILICAPGAPCSGADLSVQKTATPNPASIGQNLTYSIVVANAGPSTATGVQLSDPIPAGLDLVSTSVTPSGHCNNSNPVSCSLPDLAQGSSATVTLVVKPTTAGSINNSATVSATSVDPNLANNTGTVAVTILSDADAPNDPLFSNQWHLENRGQGGGFPGEDINVLPVWADYKGSAGQVIAIVDDGVEISHEDLAANLVSGLSYDFVSNDADPTAGLHGTSVAGIAAAAGFNGRGVSGVAPNAGLAGFRLLSASGATDAQEATALTRSYHLIAAYNNSWGPADDGKRLEGPGPLTQAALADATTKGRSGKGNIYCWAGGNGGDNDNANYDGYANSRYTIAVAASTSTGQRAAYSEKGANLLVNAPSSSGALGITTTDRSGANGYESGNYTSGFGGTSAAAPMVCGVVALMLQANPQLSWRDVKYLLATTATRNDPSDPDWKPNGAGHWVNHKYGFGRVNAAAAVQAAADWSTLNNGFVSALSASVNQPILDQGEVQSTINVGLNAKVEFVEVALDATHSDWGDLELVLTSPAGVESVLAEAHNAGTQPTPFNGWVYTSERHLDESSAGPWTLKLRDRSLGNTGQFKSWSLRLYVR